MSDVETKRTTILLMFNLGLLLAVIVPVIILLFFDWPYALLAFVLLIVGEALLMISYLRS
jgi:hypothetical protein